MNLIITVIIAVACFVAGVLVGRANPKKADKLAKIADEIKDKISQVGK